MWGQYGFDNGEFNLPYCIDVDDDGFVYVAERGGIQRFDKDSFH